MNNKNTLLAITLLSSAVIAEEVTLVNKVQEPVQVVQQKEDASVTKQEVATVVEEVQVTPEETAVVTVVCDVMTDEGLRAYISKQLGLEGKALDTAIAEASALTTEEERKSFVIERKAKKNS